MRLVSRRTSSPPSTRGSLIRLWMRLLIEMLPAEAMPFLEVFQSRMLLPLEVAAVIQEVGGEPGCDNDSRLFRSARSYARVVRLTMKIGLTALTLRPACVLGVFFVKKENRLWLIVDCRKANALFAPLPSVELVSGDGMSRIEVDSSGIAHGESPGFHYGCADVADCFHRMRLSGVTRHFFCWPGVSNKYLKMTENQGIKVSPN